jgi:hypothetical protein
MNENRTVVICNRIALWSALVFFVTFVALVGIILMANADSTPIGILATSSALTMIFAATTHVCAMALRDATANHWRFTLRTMLIATTLVAVVLGLIMWGVR